MCGEELGRERETEMCICVYVHRQIFINMTQCLHKVNHKVANYCREYLPSLFGNHFVVIFMSFIVLAVI